MAKIYAIESPALEMETILKNRLSAVSVNALRKTVLSHDSVIWSQIMTTLRIFFCIRLQY